MHVERKCLLGFIALSLVACHKSAPAPEYKKISDDAVYLSDIARLKTTPLENKSFPITVDFPGRITIPDSDIFVLSSRVQGRLESVPVTTGDSVTEGETVATLWSPDLSVAAEEWSVAKSFGDKSLLESSRQKLISLGLDPKDIKGKESIFPLHSPIAGAVLERKLSTGNAVQPGDVIMTIGKLGQLQFQGDITPDVAVKLTSGMKVFFDSYPDINATISNISQVADPNSRLVRVRATFDTAPPATLPQETFMKGNIITENVDTLVAPAKALVFTDQGEFIFIQVPGKPNEFRRVKVKINNRNAREIAISPDSNLQTGSHVVSDGALLLNNILEGND